MLAGTIYLSMCVTDFFLIDLLLIIQQRCYDIACSPALVGTLMPCLDSVMDKVATEILSRWVSFLFKKNMYDMVCSIYNSYMYIRMV